LTTEEDQQVEGRLYRGECTKRLKFLSQAIEDEATGKEWEQLRIDRFINEYLLSKGLFETADVLAQQTSLASRSFSDAAFFKSIKRIEERLGEGSTTECLQWCHENRAHLKKQGSPLEFHLRRQTFVELARRRELVQAIAYGKKFLAPWSEQFGREIEQLTALLAVGPGTGVRIYKYLYDPERWLDLQALFRREVLELHALPAAPQLISTLQAGLSAMKTPNCSKQADVNVNCPVCMPPYSDLAQGLPFSHHENSAIVCRISGALMDENNPPMVLPNGHVYSRASLERLAALDGTVQCPRTGATYSLSQARKVFIM
jgi:macrophage erythroblast attacher